MPMRDEDDAAMEGRPQSTVPESLVPGESHFELDSS